MSCRQLCDPSVKFRAAGWCALWLFHGHCASEYTSRTVQPVYLRARIFMFVDMRVPVHVYQQSQLGGMATLLGRMSITPSALKLQVEELQREIVSSIPACLHLNAYILCVEFVVLGFSFFVQAVRHSLRGPGCVEKRACVHVVDVSLLLYAQSRLQKLDNEVREGLRLIEVML